MLELEQLLKVFFAESGSKADLLATLAASQQWAQARCTESLAVGETYLDGRGPFPERLAVRQLTGRFITDFYLLVLEWADRAAAVVGSWPDQPGQASSSRSVLEETVDRARRGTQRR